MIGKKTLNLKWKLFLAFGLFLLIPSLVIGLFSYSSTRDNVEETMLEQASHTTANVHASLQQFMELQTDSVHYAGRTINVKELSDEQLEQRLVDLTNINENILEVYLVGQTGEAVAYNSSTGFGPEEGLQESSWFKQANARQVEVSISEPILTVEGEEEHVEVIMGTLTADSTNVLGIRISLKELTGQVNAAKIGSTGYMYLADQFGRIVTHPTRETGEFLPVNLMQQFEDESGQFQSEEDGVVRELNYNKISPTDWVLVGAMLPNEASQTVQPILQTMLIVIAATLVVGCVIIYFVVRSVVAPLSGLAKMANVIKSGNLGAKYEGKALANDEIGALAEAFDDMRNSLILTLSHIQDKATYLASSSEELQASTEQNMQATEQITLAVQEVSSGVDAQSSSMEQGRKATTSVSQGISDIVLSASSVQTAVDQAAAMVDSGQKGVERSVSQMNAIDAHVSELASTIESLEQQAKTIGQVIRLISDISEQTNLLALNASIEAARAGEHGRGFAVVADEVRKLAEQTNEAAQNVQEQIRGIQTGTMSAGKAMQAGKGEVAKGVKVIQDAGDSFTAIQSHMDEVRQKINQVTNEAKQMSIQTEQFMLSYDNISQAAETTSAHVQNVSAATEEQLASMEEILSSTTNLSALAEELEEMIQRFKW
ncbi:methyl-accepting chemotaxis protein [Shouchella clausii]|uniref:methyl-accepting chemotaxis protein n=1 Tax=Shouchella clausii TaxID=79880 RepID=UPI0007970AAF|nr:methyl-accepting chemotaxis protein [Shouchella clausii]KKI86696.1 hypothetical protein WZ76_09715 [Shouchella clausii]PAD47493.1 methyl-accepting chemotaxis protein [Shouchella clausii]